MSFYKLSAEKKTPFLVQLEIFSTLLIALVMIMVSQKFLNLRPFAFFQLSGTRSNRTRLEYLQKKKIPLGCQKAGRKPKGLDISPVHVVLVSLLVDQLSSLFLPCFGRPKKKFVQSQGIFGQALIFLVKQISFWYT